MNKSDDPFEPENLRCGLLQVARRKSPNIAGRNGKGVRRYPKALGFQFYQFPVKVLDQILLSGLDSRLTVLAVLLNLYELWFTNFKRNPVRLTSYSLRKYGISKDQKFRALHVLEKSGQITVERRHGENPLVTLNWLPLQNDLRGRREYDLFSLILSKLKKK